MSSAHTPTTTLRLHISLLESPRPVWRRVVVSQALTLEGLHRVIQLLTQGWDYHLYFFTIRRKLLRSIPALREAREMFPRLRDRSAETRWRCGGTRCI